MYNMYPPPWGGFPPQPPMNPDQFQVGMRFAAKLAQREDREKERKKHHERKLREEDRQRATATQRRFWLCIELYIFGIITQPFVLYGYTHLLKAVTP